jgi:N-acetylmuramoyl-L-alanine amidase
MPRVLVKWVLSLIIQRKYTRFRSGQNEIAKAISDAIISYKNEYYGNGGNENSTNPTQKYI